MSHALFPQCPIETLDVRLLILLVRACSAMAFGMEKKFLMTFGFELRSSIALPDDEATHDLRCIRNAFLPFFSFKRLSDLYVCLTCERVDCGVGKQFSEVYGVTFAHISAFLRFRDCSSCVIILLPFLSENHMFSQGAVDARKTDVPAIFLPQPESDLLTTPSVLSANLQDELRGDPGSACLGAIGTSSRDPCREVVQSRVRAFLTLAGQGRVCRWELSLIRIESRCDPRSLDRRRSFCGRTSCGCIPVLRLRACRYGSTHRRSSSSRRGGRSYY